MPRLTPATGPIGLDEAIDLLAPMTRAKRIIIAVSGGPDSTALMQLAALVGGARLVPPVTVATVDHGLQAASLKVASHVIERAQALGFESHLLRWHGPKPATGIQEAARRNRYRLLTDLAKSIDATHLVTAHTLDDQAETILFRMARGSGPAGLAGMRPSVLREGVIHVRPFLGIAKRRLIETCEAQGWPFVDDPANRDPRYARTRLRALLPSLAAEGLTAEGFALIGRRLARDEAALRALAAAALEKAGLDTRGDRKIVKSAALLAEPEAVVLRALDIVLTDFARPGPPRLARLESVVEELRDAHMEGKRLRRTLHGHIVVLDPAGRIEFFPEGQRRRGLGP